MIPGGKRFTASCSLYQMPANEQSTRVWETVSSLHVFLLREMMEVKVSKTVTLRNVVKFDHH